MIPKSSLLSGMVLLALACSGVPLHAASDTLILPRADTPPVAGALASWDFEDGSGDTLRDRTGNGHHGIIHGAKWVAGMKGKGLDFDGEAWVEVPADSALNVTSFTFSIWLKQSGNGFRVPLMEYQLPSAPVGVSLWANTSGWGTDLPGAFYANLRPHDASASQPGSVRERNLLNTEAGTAQGCRWNHVVLAFDQAASKVRIHVNGKLQAFRSVDPFTPRTVGSIFMGIRSPSSVEWDAGMGLVGTLDQADLFGRALGESEVAALYGRPPADPKTIHLGIKTHHAKAGDTLWVPLYLSSVGKDSLASLQFNLELDTTVAVLLDVKVDTAVAPDWQLSEWNRQNKSPIALALAGTHRITGPEEGEFIRLKLRVVDEARNGASTMLTLTGISADEGRDVAVSHTPGRIFVFDPHILHGDVTGDGNVDLIDAKTILRHVVGSLALPSTDFPNFTLAVADVSGNGAITSYDAALVLQYGLGIIDDFPVERKVLLKRSSAQAVMIMGMPVHAGGDTWRYRITGTDLEGLIAGELSLQTASTVTGIASVSTGMAGIRVSYGYDPASRRLDVALAANRKGPAGAVQLLEVEAIHAPGSSQPGLTLKSAYLNEGRLSVTGVDSKPLIAHPIATSLDKAGQARLTLGNRLVQLAVPDGVIQSVEISDIRGRNILARRFGSPVQSASFSSAGLPSGLLAFKVVGDRGAWNLVLPHFHP
jgi:hypothetical protein